MAAAEETPETQEIPEAPAPKKRGPKSREEIRAELEAELRGEIEAQVRAELEEQERKERAAREAVGAARPISGEEISGDPAATGAVTIHFVDDGFTILGKVWYVGEPLVLVPGTAQWEEATITTTRGEVKCFALMDEDEQIEKWGRRMFRPGLWRGKRLDEIDDAELTPQEREILKGQQQKYEQRYGALVK